MLVNNRFSRFAFGVVALAAASCSDESVGPVRGTHVRLASDSMFLGSQAGMIAVSTNDSAHFGRPAFVWTSSNTNAIAIDDTGRVLAVGLGTSTIAADLDGERDSITIRVVLRREDNGIPMDSTSRGFGAHCGLAASNSPLCRVTDAADSIGTYVALAGTLPSPIRALAATQAHQCALTDVGAMFCWGSDTTGAFMRGSRGPTSNLTAVAAAPGFQFTAIAVGSSNGFGHTCGIGKADSVVYCAGNGAQGQLGRAANTFATVVTAVPNVRALAISASPTRTCVIDLTTNGLCWGANVSVPQAVLQGLSLTAIAAGSDRVCGITTQKKLHCASPVISSPIPVAGDLDFKQVIVGETPTASAPKGYACGLTTAGALLCWGEFPPLALSGAFPNRATTPVPLAAGVTFTSISGDSKHICGVTSDDRVYCI